MNNFLRFLIIGASSALLAALGMYAYMDISRIKDTAVYDQSMQRCLDALEYQSRKARGEI